MSGGIGFGPLPQEWNIWHSLAAVIVVALVVWVNLRDPVNPP